MQNKRVRPSWGRVFLVLALGMVLFALVHQLVIPTWAHMMLQIGTMLLTYTLTLAGYEPPDSSELEDFSRDRAGDRRPTSLTDHHIEHAASDKEATTLSFKGKSS
jgi:hypothetical protein